MEGIWKQTFDNNSLSVINFADKFTQFTFHNIIFSHVHSNKNHVNIRKTFNVMNETHFQKENQFGLMSPLRFIPYFFSLQILHLRIL